MGKGKGRGNWLKSKQRQSRKQRYKQHGYGGQGYDEDEGNKLLYQLAGTMRPTDTPVGDLTILGGLLSLLNEFLCKEFLLLLSPG